MQKFRVLINGENFLIEVEDKLQKMGFFVTRIIEAASMEEAEILAIDLLKQDARLKAIVRNQSDDPPMLYIEEKEEIQSGDLNNINNTGFSWYSCDKK
ncbi:MAG: hypothetical protein AB1757_09020 [Acidobacteriota bacterium]